MLFTDSGSRVPVTCSSRPSSNQKASPLWCRWFRFLSEVESLNGAQELSPSVSSLWTTRTVLIRDTGRRTSAPFTARRKWWWVALGSINYCEIMYPLATAERSSVRAHSVSVSLGPGGRGGDRQWRKAHPPPWKCVWVIGTFVNSIMCQPLSDERFNIRWNGNLLPVWGKLILNKQNTN